MIGTALWSQSCRAMAERITLGEVRTILDADVVWCPDLSIPVQGVVAADLMSDVLMSHDPGVLLLTGLVSLQAVRTAAIMDLAGIVFVGGKPIRDEIIAAAEEKNVPLFVTACPMFEAAGRLYVATAAPGAIPSGAATNG
jgi:predicted transcriptional regulator